MDYAGIIKKNGKIVKKAHSKTGVHGMSDERILGDSDFVSSILVQAEESYDRRYQLKTRGFDVNRVAAAVAQIFQMKPREIFSKGRQKQKVKG